MTGEKRAQAIELRSRGMSFMGIAIRLRIGKASVVRVLKQHSKCEYSGPVRVQPGDRCPRCFLLEPHVCLPKCDASAQRRSP